MKRLGAEFANITQISEHYRAKCFIRKAITPEKAVPEWSVFLLYLSLALLYLSLASYFALLRNERGSDNDRSDRSVERKSYFKMIFQ